MLEALAKIAPVTAIRGNTDRDGPCAKLPETDVTLIADRYIYMLHDLNTLHLDPAAGKFAAVLFGHTHVPNFYHRKDIHFFARNRLPQTRDPKTSHRLPKKPR